jgi:hypothetical protein
MKASVKKCASALGKRKAVGLLVAVILVGVAAGGWASSWASQQDTIGGGQYNLQPAW